MQDDVALADISRRLRQLAKTRNLHLTKPKHVEEELAACGVDDVDILNVFRTGTMTDETGENQFRVGGRLDDGTPIAFYVTIDEILDIKAKQPAPRVRIEKVRWPNGKPERRKTRSMKGKVQIIRKLRSI